MNAKLLNEVDELLDILVADCYEQLEFANDQTTANQLLINSVNTVLNKWKTDEIKKQQGAGYIERKLVLFDSGDKMQLPLFPEEVQDDYED
jgi:hypothetical protein